MIGYPKTKHIRVKDEDVKRSVRLRDGFCVAGRMLRDGCGEGVDVHHIHSRGSGGGDVKENMICMCRIHHNKAHNGLITRKQLEGWLEKLYGYQY